MLFIIKTKSKAIVINTNQSYQINNKIIDIDLAHLPALSSKSQDILCKELGITLPERLRSIPTATSPVSKHRAFKDLPLEGRIQHLKETSQLLEKAQKEGFRDKLIACLKVASLITFLAGYTLGCLLAPEFFLPALFLPLFVYLIGSGLLFESASVDIQEVEKRSPHYQNTENRRYVALFLLGAQFVLPLWEAFTKESRLQKIVQEQRTSIEETLTEYKRENEQRIPFISQFYREHSQEIRSKLDWELKRLKDALSYVQTAPSMAGFQDERIAFSIHQSILFSLEARSEFQKKINSFLKAKEEFELVSTFYSQFSSLN